MDTTINSEKINHPYKEISFFYSPWYTVILSVFVYLFWLFDLGVYGLTVMIVLAGVICALCKDLSPIIPIAFVFVQVVSDTLGAAYAYIYYICSFVLLIAGVVIHFIRFKPYRNYGKVKGFPVAVGLCGIAILFGGITIAPERSLFPALIVVFYGLLATGSGFFFYATLGQKDSKRLRNTVIGAILASSCIAFIQLITLILSSDNPMQAISSKYELNAGYGHPNYLANIIARSIPLCIYLSVSNKKYSFLWLVAAYVCGIGIILTSSRATLLVAFIVSVICLVYFFRKLDYKVNWICTVVMLIGVTMVGLAVVYNKLETMFSTLFNMGLDSNGRFDLWKIGMERFASHPIFGVGLDYDLGGREDLTNTAFTPYWYHNTFVQILCSLGIFGFIAYGFYFYRQYRTFAVSKNNAVKSLMFVIILMQGISMLDIFFLTPQEFLQMVIITTVALRSLPENKENTHIYEIIEFAKKHDRLNIFKKLKRRTEK